MADSDDEDFTTTELPSLEDAVAHGSRLDVLQALAALAAHELEGNRCSKCHMNYMKTGEISSLMLRLQKIYEEIEILDPKAKPASTGSERKSIRDIRSATSLALVIGGNADTQDSGVSESGTKSSPRRRQGSNKPRR